jgi:hypothetical protein
MVLNRGAPQSPRSKAGAKWLSKIRKGQVAPKGLHLPIDLQKILSFSLIDFF